MNINIKLTKTYYKKERNYSQYYNLFWKFYSQNN